MNGDLVSKTSLGLGPTTQGLFTKPPRHRGGIERDWWLTGRRGVRRTHGLGGTTLLLLTLRWPAGLDGGGWEGGLWMSLSEEDTLRVILSIASAALTPLVSVQGRSWGTESGQRG